MEHHGAGRTLSRSKNKTPNRVSFKLTGQRTGILGCWQPVNYSVPRVVHAGGSGTTTPAQPANKARCPSHHARAFFSNTTLVIKAENNTRHAVRHRPARLRIVPPLSSHRHVNTVIISKANTTTIRAAARFSIRPRGDGPSSFTTCVQA